MIQNKSDKIQFSRRHFIQLMAGASLASISGAIPDVQAWAKAPPTRTVPLPKFKVSIGTPAAERYQVPA